MNSASIQTNSSMLELAAASCVFVMSWSTNSDNQSARRQTMGGGESRPSAELLEGVSVLIEI